METAARFCKHCGTAFGDDSARYCKRCGAARPEPVETVRPAASSAAGGTAALGRVAGIANQVAGAGGLAASLPWQIIGAGQSIDAAALLRVAAPGVARAAARSLRRPGLVLAFTVAVSLAVALLTGGSEALIRVLPQLLAGAAASGLSLLTGAKTGSLRTAAGVVSVLAAVVTLATLAVTLYGGLTGGDSLLSLLPVAIAAGASLLAAAKAALVALRGS